ncbi:hypothetical protein PPUJ20005_18470 [Pseudomonas putida]|jgi:threonine/homoserine/homoserine lactone efflux protein|nr:hypothetical protein PPUJ20005_18470 [Pseudomonas putida]
MPETTQLLTFALICLGMVLTPGPNMIYLISRSMHAGRRAPLIVHCAARYQWLLAEASSAEAAGGSSCGR